MVRAWEIQARREERKSWSAWVGVSDGASIEAAAASASAWAATERRRSARRSRARCAIWGRNASTSCAWCASSGTARPPRRRGRARRAPPAPARTARGLQEQALVEPPPDVLGGVDEVLGARRRRVEPDPPAGRGGRCGGGGLGGRRERREGVGDAGEVAGDGVGGLLDEEYRVRGVEEVAVAAADELAELLLLGGDLAARGALRRADLWDASRAEQLLGVGRAAAGDCRGRHRRLDLGARGEIQEGSDRD